PDVDDPSSSTNESSIDDRDDSTTSTQQQGDDYYIARDRARRQIRKPATYINDDNLVAYALSIAQE
ncbi:hypothetical protein A2U01_0084488, partial [Trifolium medium]|nr:hypothetical protein [Trifolium medium]